MENEEVLITIKANTKPITASMEKLMDDISVGTKSIEDFTDELEKSNTVELDGITDALQNELNSSRIIIENVGKELDKLEAEKITWTNPPTDLLKAIDSVKTDLQGAKEMASNFKTAMDTALISSGMKNFNTTLDDTISLLKYGIGDMQQFNALVDNASKKQLKNIASNLKTGLQEAQNEVTILQQKLLSAIVMDASPKSVERLQFELTNATAKVGEFQGALKTMGSTSMTTGETVSAVFSSIGSSIKASFANVKRTISMFKRMFVTSVIFSFFGAIRKGFSDAIELSSSATGKFTAMSNAISGSLIPVVETLARVVQKAFVWVAGLINFLTGGKFNLIQKAIDGTNKKIDKLGKKSKGAGKSVKDGLLSGLDEINNIDTSSDGGGGGGVVGDDMSGQLSALTELQDMMAQMNALNFSWAEPLKNVFQWIVDNWQLVAIGILGISLVIGALNTSSTLAGLGISGMTKPLLAIALAIAGVVSVIWGLTELFKKNGDEGKAWIAIGGGLLAIVIAIGVAFGLTAGLWALLVAVVVAGIIAVIKYWDEIVAFLKKTCENIGNFFKGLWNGIVAIFSGIGKWFGDRIDEIIAFFVSFPTRALIFFKNLWTSIKNVFGGIGQWFGDRVDDIVDFFKSLPNKVWTFIKKLWDKITGLFINVGSAVGDTISGAIKGAINAVLKTAVKIINGFISAINFAIGIINDIPGVSIKKLTKLEVPSFDVGTDYVPQDMIAMVHKGERITPAKYNDDNWSGEVDMSETNGLLEQLIEVVISKNFSINRDEIGQASVDYINAETRRRGVGLI